MKSTQSTSKSKSKSLEPQERKAQCTHTPCSIPSVPLPKTLKTASDWFQLIPFGTVFYPNGVQHFGRLEADEIVRNFYSLGGKFSRLFGGLPILMHNKSGTRIKTCGYVRQLEVRETGLWTLVKWNTAGKNLLRRKVNASLTPECLLRTITYSDSHDVSASLKLLSVKLSRDTSLPVTKNKLNELISIPPKVKRPRLRKQSINAVCITENLLGQSHPSKNSRDRLLTLVHNHMTKTGQPYLKSWNTVKQQNSDLFHS